MNETTITVMKLGKSNVIVLIEKNEFTINMNPHSNPKNIYFNTGDKLD